MLRLRSAVLFVGLCLLAGGVGDLLGGVQVPGYYCTVWKCTGTYDGYDLVTGASVSGCQLSSISAAQICVTQTGSTCNQDESGKTYSLCFGNYYPQGQTIPAQCIVKWYPCQ
jgi:hypothetical protein